MPPPPPSPPSHPPCPPLRACVTFPRAAVIESLIARENSVAPVCCAQPRVPEQPAGCSDPARLSDPRAHPQASVYGPPGPSPGPLPGDAPAPLTCRPSPYDVAPQCFNPMSATLCPVAQQPLGAPDPLGAGRTVVNTEQSF